MAQAAMDFDVDTDKGFSFCLTPDYNERECDEWNTQCTAKLERSAHLGAAEAIDEGGRNL